MIIERIVTTEIYKGMKLEYWDNDMKAWRPCVVLKISGTEEHPTALISFERGEEESWWDDENNLADETQFRFY